MKIVNILIVEDEPLLCDYYKMVFKEITNCHIGFNTHLSHTFDVAHQKIREFQKLDTKLDLAILDLRLRDLKTKVVKDGKDLGLLLRRTMSNTKIVFITSIVSHLRFYEIFQLVDPEGLIIKDEIADHDKFILAVRDILDGGLHYSKTVEEFLKNQTNGVLKLDQTDRKLLHLLANGVKTKDVANRLNVSLSTIEKRKQHIAEIFHLEHMDNENLVRIARKKMII